MNTAIVLDVESPSFLRQAGEVNTLVSNGCFKASHVELWLFSYQEKIQQIPEMACPISEIRVFQTAQSHAPENHLELLEYGMEHYPMQLLIFSDTEMGEALATRLAFRLNGSICLQVGAVKTTSSTIEIEKSAYGSHLTARLLLESPPYCLAAASTGAQKAALIPCDTTRIHLITVNHDPLPWIIDQKMIPAETARGLLSADVVLVAGQGVGSSSAIEFIQKVADAMGAELGGSRQAVMNGWLPVDRLLGVSGKAVSPKICITAGVSGSPVFTTGIQNSDCIIAINSDKEAPIFKMAHVGIVGDLKAVLTALLHLIDEHKRLNGIEK